MFYIKLKAEISIKVVNNSVVIVFRGTENHSKNIETEKFFMKFFFLNPKDKNKITIKICSTFFFFIHEIFPKLAMTIELVISAYPIL